MSTPILATKLYIPPPRQNLVFRPRLIERLNEGLHRKLTLISAPAGFGKTTLISSWIAELRAETTKQGEIGNPTSRVVNQVAWLSLDERDNEPARFLAYLVAALQTVAPDIGATVLGALQSPQLPSIESMLTTLLNEIATIPDNFVLVLDDVHLIEAKPVDQALTFLLEHLPPQMHLVITTREDPPLPLARYRVRGQMTELRATALRFTLSEAAGFLNQVMGLNLPEQDIAALETRTEGWIAGLQMAALSMQRRADTAGFIRAFTGSHRFVLDYLVEEVLQSQTEGRRSFLLQTSILNRLTGPLCDAVLSGGADEPGSTGGITPSSPRPGTSVPRPPSPVASGQETLEYLEHANLFVIPLDDERQWYRYHHLFADVLQAHLMQEQPNQLPGLHRRASEWYEQNGLPADAIRHALAAGDFERTARLAELVWPAMDARFQSATWLGWVKALPDELIRARPVLSMGYAWALLNGGQMEAGAARLRDAERWLDPAAEAGEQPLTPPAGMVVVDEAQFRALPASIATARAYIAQALGDIPGSVIYARRVLDLLPEDDHLGRGPAAALLGLAHWANGELEAAHRALANAMTNFQKAGNIVFAISGTYGLADIRIAQGRLREAVSIYEQALQLAAVPDEPTLPGTADLYLGLGELYRERGDLETANQYLQRSEELGEQAALQDWPYRLRCVQARIKETQGEPEAALKLLDEAERLYFRTPIPNVRPVTALKARVWIRQGRVAKALDWAHERGLSAADNLSYLREFEHMTLARVLIARYQRDRLDRLIFEAMGLLERLLKAAEEGGRMGSVIEILVLQALAHQAQGNISPALAPLERALTLAEPEGYVQIFVGEGPPMARILSAAVAHGSMPDYAGKLLATFNAGAPQSKDKSYLPAAQPLIEPLSQRELEVLQLLAQGLSNREIGERLYLALDTIKGHNRRIYGKLQVQRRTEAVARARKLGLV